MACINIFKPESNGGKQVLSDNGELSLRTKTGEISVSFENAKKLAANLDIDELSTFDKEFLSSLEDNGFINNWKSNKNQLALGLFAKLHTKGFTRHFGDWVNSTDVKGEIDVNGEPVIRDGKVHIGANVFDLLGEGHIKDTSVEIKDVDLDNESTVWVTPGSNVKGLVDHINQRNLSAAQRKAAFDKMSENLGEFELFPGVFATEEQQDAITKIGEFLNGDSDDVMFTLIGRGGTGKSTIIQKAIANAGISVHEVVYTAPTKKARDVLADMVDPDAGVYTVHAAYGFGVTGKYDSNNSPIFDRIEKKKAPAEKLNNKVIVVDEGSMIDTQFYNHILETAKDRGHRVIVMADNVQLGAIKDNSNDSQIFNHVKAKLTKRIRQSDTSPILPITDILAEAVETADKNPSAGKIVAIPENARITQFDPESNTGVIFDNSKDNFFAYWKKDFDANPYSTKMVTFNNAAYTGRAEMGLAEVNRTARQLLYGDVAQNTEYILGELLVANNDVMGEDGLEIENSSDYVITSIEPIQTLKNEVVTNYGGKSFLLPNLEYTEVTVQNVKDLREGADKVRTTENLKLLTAESKAKVRAIVNKLSNRTVDLSKINPSDTEFIDYINNILPGANNRSFAGALKGHFPDLEYGYGITSHKAQGSTYRNVYVVEDNITGQGRGNAKGINQSLYVATSRASDKLVMLSKLNTPKKNTKVEEDKENKAAAVHKVGYYDTFFASPDGDFTNRFFNDKQLETIMDEARVETTRKIKEAVKEGTFKLQINDEGNLDNSLEPALVTDFNENTREVTFSRDGEEKVIRISDELFDHTAKGLIPFKKKNDREEAISNIEHYLEAIKTPIPYYMLEENTIIDNGILKAVKNDDTVSDSDFAIIKKAVQRFNNAHIPAGAVNIMRNYNYDFHYGNPFTGSKKIKGLIQVTEDENGNPVQFGSKAAIEAASKKYKQWVRGDILGVDTDRFEDFIFSISAGYLDGKSLLYMNTTKTLRDAGITDYYSHADALAEIVNDPDSRIHIDALHNVVTDLHTRLDKDYDLGIRPTRKTQFGTAADAKAEVKNKVANRFIGAAKDLDPVNSVTREYTLQALAKEKETGEKFVNVESYDENDVVFAAIPGRRAPVVTRHRGESFDVHSSSGEYQDLSNFAVRPFTVTTNGPLKGMSFNTVEGAFQAAKILTKTGKTITVSELSEKERNNITALQKTENGFDALKIGRQSIENFDSAAWDARSSAVVKGLMKASFSQNPDALERLTGTGMATLTHNKVRSAWKTKFPKILMEVRAELFGHHIQEKVLRQAINAVTSGATIVTDPVEDIKNNSYKVGEKTLIERLQNIGARYTTQLINGELIGVWKLPKKDALLIPKYTVDRNLSIGEGKVLAISSISKGIRLNVLSSLDEFYNYFEGGLDSEGSQQKKIVLKELDKLGYSLDNIKKLVDTKKDAYLFLVFHEESHLRHNDPAVYFKNGRLDYTTKDKIEIEVRATVDAIEKLKKFKKARKKYVKKNVVTEDTNITPKAVSQNQESHLASKGKKGSKTAPASENIAVVLEDEVMKKLGMTDRVELQDYIANTDQTTVEKLFNDTHDELNDAGKKIYTSQFNMLDKADVIFYNTNIASIKQGAGKVDFNNLSNWNMQEASKAVNFLSSKISGKKGKKINLDSVKGGLSTLSTNDISSKSAQTTIEVLDRMLNDHPELLIRGYDKILGANISADVKSQLLSAATDNAKELILGKIGANDDTNGIITAMLLMGHDLTTIVDFLNTPEITKVLKVWEEKKNNKDLKPLTWYAITTDNTFDGIVNTPELQSLKRILTVSSDILQFAGIRSLSENFKVHSFAIDGIFDGVFPDALYRAIVAEDTAPIVKATAEYRKLHKDDEIKSKYGDVFNPNFMIFYHPQSKVIFKRLYENEKFLMPSLFKSKKFLDRFLTEYDRNEDVYKSVNRYMSKMYVQDFYRTPDENGNYRVGVLPVKKLGGTVELKKFPLNTYEGREKFLNEFPKFLEYAKNRLKTLGYENIAVNNMTFDKSFGSTMPTLNIRSYHSSQSDGTVKASIKQAIDDMKTEIPNNPEINELHKMLYSNLSNYAMITSNGKPGSGNMLQLFHEINVDLSKHIHELGDSFYKEVLPEVQKGTPNHNIFKTLVTNRVPTRDALKSRADGKMSNEFADEAAEFQQEYMDDDYFGGMVLRDNASTLLYSEGFAGNIYTRPDIFALKDAVFFESGVGRPMQVFDTANPLAIGNSVTTDNLSVYGISDEINKALMLSGKQIGKSAILNGQNVRVLNYEDLGNVEVNGEIYPEYFYAVAFDGDSTFRLVPGSVLMNQNPNLVLYGNVITDMSASSFKFIRNVASAIPAMADTYSNQDYKATKTSEINSYMDIDDNFRQIIRNSNITNDDYLFTEYSMAKLADGVITSDIKSGNAPGYDMFRDTRFMPEIQPTSSVFLIPALRNFITGDKKIVVNNVTNNINKVLNNRASGTTVTFIMHTMKDVNKPNLVPGAKLLHEALGNSNHYELGKPVSKEDGTVSIDVTKKSDEMVLNFNGENVYYTLGTTDNVDRLKASGATNNDQAKLYGLYSGLADGTSYNVKIVSRDSRQYMLVGNGKISGPSDVFVYDVSMDDNLNIVFAENTDMIEAEKKVLTDEMIEENKNKTCN